MTIFIATFLGMFNANLFLSPTLNNQNLEKYDLSNKLITIEGTVKNILNQKWSQNGDLSVNYIYIKNKKLNLKGKIKFKNSSKIKPNIGDKILLRGMLEIPQKEKNFGAFNYKLYLKRNKIFYTTKIKHNRNIKILSKNNLSILEKTRLKFKNRILSFSQNKDVSGFYLSILLGDKSYLNKNLKNNMISLGIIHLLAISGFHIAILFSLIYLLLLFLLRLNINLIKKIDIFKLSLVISIVFIIFYLILINFQTSATRAVIMIVLFSLSKIFERKFNSINILALAALIILLIDNSAFLSIGFYLSFLAVLSFFIPIKILKTYFENLNKYQKFILNYIAVNFSIFIITTPILLFTFYKVSLGQIIFNFIFIPIFSFIIYPISLFSFIFEIKPLISLNYKFFYELSNNLTGNYFFVSPINLIQLILSLFIIVVIFYLLLKKENKKILLFLLLYFIIILFPVNREEEGLNVYFLSVGNGDATLISINNKTVLIDAGSKLNGNNGKNVIIPHLDYFNIKKIDYAIITHLDEDHYGGFEDLIKENRINTVISSVKLPQKLINNDIKYKIITKTEIINLSDLKLHLFPSNNFKDDNNNSIITYFEYKNVKFLLTGDAAHKREKLFMEKHKNIKNINILKLGHHGSKKSSSINFLKKLNPKIAIISNGKNNHFHHPHKETLKRLNDLGIMYYRTDFSGEIHINILKKIKISLLFDK
jgi:competence protein ComEC